jgi:hypothetical protein
MSASHARSVAHEHTTFAESYDLTSTHHSKTYDRIQSVVAQVPASRAYRRPYQLRHSRGRNAGKLYFEASHFDRPLRRINVYAILFIAGPISRPSLAHTNRNAQYISRRAWRLPHTPPHYHLRLS